MIEKSLEKIKAVKLRKKGLSYREILEKIPVAKSTLSLWLKDVGLSTPQKQRLTQKRLDAIQRGGLAKHKQRIEKTLRIKSVAMGEVKKLINDPFWLTGVILYWAEGHKERPWMSSSKTSLINMDFRVLIIFKLWLIKYCEVKPEDLIYELYIHPNGDINKSKKYWAENLSIDTKTIRQYFKKPNLKSKRKNVGNNYYGILNIKIRRSADLNRKIAGWIDGVIKYLY